MKTITRRSALTAAIALPCVGVAGTTVAGEGPEFLALLADLKKLPPRLREAVIQLARALAEEERARRAKVTS